MSLYLANLEISLLTKDHIEINWKVLQLHQNLIYLYILHDNRLSNKEIADKLLN